MHCSDAPCAAVCPVDCFYTTEDGVVLHDKDICIGCGYCFYACPFGAPQFPADGAATRGKMDKCTFCAGGPLEDNSAEEFCKYGSKPACRGQIAALRRDASTKALLAGDANVLSRSIASVSSIAPAARCSGVSFQNATLRSPRGLQGKASTIE